MANERQNKVARLLQKELAGIFLRRAKTFFGNAMITVTTVRVSPDFSSAKVYLSIFNTKSATETMDIVETEAWAIKKELSENVKKQLRKLPEITYFIDDSLDYVENIEKLLKGNK